MSKALNTGLFALKAILFLVGVVLLVIILKNGDPSDIDTEQEGIKAYNAYVEKNQANPEESHIEMGQAIKEAKVADITSGVGLAINFTIFILVVTAIAVLLFAVFSIGMDFKGAIPSLIGVALFIGVLLLAYLLASDDIPSSVKVGTAADFKLASWAVITFYLLAGAAAIAWIGGELMRIFK
ncbi:MAG: hypothetical protein ACK4K0_04455 [Flavobacteriales bacterium]